jgi:calcineurin-like phosphoesterase family protein
MNNIFFLSDTHFFHDNIIKCCNRPFESCVDQDETIIKNWNSVIKKGDLVYHLGDIAWGGDYSVLKRMNGQKIIIKGNHDKTKNLENAVENKYIETWHYQKGFMYKNDYIFMSHFPHLRWDRCSHDSYHAFGHSHGKLDIVFGRSMDVSIDCIDFTPIHIDDFRSKLKHRENKYFYSTKTEEMVK